MKLAVVTPINSPDGISEYSRSLYWDKFPDISYLANKDIVKRLAPDKENIHRLWEWDMADTSPISDWINLNTPDVVHIQHHPAFFDLQALGQLIENIDPKVKLFLTPHVVTAPGFDLTKAIKPLSKLTKVYVHKESDFEILSLLGLSNLEHFIHPYWEFPAVDKTELRTKIGVDQYSPIIATHGLVGPHKGLLEVATAVAELKQNYPNLLWLSINAVNPDSVESSTHYEQLQAKIDALGIQNQVILFPQFLPESTVIQLIKAADIGILPYSEVGEAASGAVRKFIGSWVPTIVTDIPWMREFSTQVYKILTKDPFKIVNAAKIILEDKSLQQRMIDSCKETVERYGWTASAEKLNQDYLAAIASSN